MVAVGSLHNTRILRFFLVLIVVLLTIFIYASYSTTATLTPTHMHSLSAALAAPTPQQLTGHQQQQSEQLPAMVALNNTGEFGLSPGEELLQPSSSSSNGNNRVKQLEPLHNNKKQTHRLPTIDEDALRDGGAAGASPMAAGSDQSPNLLADDPEEQQYVQNIDGISGSINSNNNSESVLSARQAAVAAVSQQQQQEQQQQQQQQMPSDADTLMIPTSNLQKFIENADKILKNMTSNSSNPAAIAAGGGVGAAVGGGAATGVLLPNEQHTDKTNQPGLMEDVPINLLDNNSNKNNNGAGSYAVMPVKMPAEENEKPQSPPAAKVPKAKSTNKATSLDPSKGIAAEQIYESGHLNDEISIERICPANGLSTRLLILITSAQTHADARMSIRQTWGHYGTRRDISMAFVLGRGTNETVNEALSQENFMYGDLIRGNFIDSYNNLTLKTISSLEWIDQHCPRAQYILKTDDDMFINVPKLLKFLDKRKEKRAIYGRLAKKWKPVRNKKSKYYVATDQFPAAVFPSFTTGPAYVMTGSIVHDLYVRSLTTVYLKLEDVFATGIVAQSLGIERLHVNEFVNRRISFNPCNIRNAISVHMIKSNEQFDLWKKLLDQTTKCK
ncbi:uncharacterized protein LOC6561984 [Drosophila grimshawi]|uniref:GH11617 n=5 Tax=picture wing clade TaxID=48384 RepID=B4JC07_DROGR|nr:uncharacterized protein LOC6561984 [Drosophila grimshawi]EDW04110.1 GH11617 [Drosophila grimshawi]